MWLAASDAELVLKSLDGDESAFGGLYDKYAKLVLAISRENTHELASAQDLTQEVFLRAYSKLGLLKDHDRFGPWLISITKNVGREFRRSKGRDRLVLLGQESEELSEPPKQEPERVQLLEKAMSLLNEKERLALHVHYLQGADSEQGKQLLGMSRSSYYRLVDRAKKRVGRIIEKLEK